MFHIVMRTLPLLSLILASSLAAQTTPCTERNTSPCQTFTQRATAFNDLLARFRASRNFDALPQTPNTQNDAAIKSAEYLHKSSDLVLDTVMNLPADHALRWPMLDLWIAQFRAIDEGRAMEQHWFATWSGPKVCILWDSPDPNPDAEQDETVCAHINDAGVLRNVDMDSSKSFNFMIAGNKYVFAPEDRPEVLRRLQAADLTDTRRAVLISCFDHGGEPTWDPPNLYPDVPPKF